MPILTSSNKNQTSFKSEDGFTLLEMVVATLIITIGLLATAAAITYALEMTSVSRNASNAKMFIVSTFEEIDNLRNTNRLTFEQIANAGAVDNTSATTVFAGFSTGFQSLSLNPGPDGVNGTADDLSVGAGTDGDFGTADDVTDDTLIRSGYTREIVITELNPALKKVEVTVRYFSAGDKVGTLRGVAYFNDDANVTRH